VPLIGGNLRAAIDIGDDFLVGVQLYKHSTLKGEALLLSFRARPCVIVRFFPVLSVFGVAIQLGMIRVVRDGPGVSEGGMVPGRFAHRERGFDRPRFHPAAPPLANDRDVIPRRSEQCTQSHKLQCLPRARAKLGISPNLDAIDDFRLPVTENFHEGSTHAVVERKLQEILEQRLRRQTSCGAEPVPTPERLG